MNVLTFKLNTYIAALVVTIFGAGASLLIIHVANASTLATAQLLALPTGF